MGKWEKNVGIGPDMWKAEIRRRGWNGGCKGGGRGGGGRKKCEKEGRRGGGIEFS